MDLNVLDEKVICFFWIQYKLNLALRFPIFETIINLLLMGKNDSQHSDQFFPNEVFHRIHKLKLFNYYCILVKLPKFIYKLFDMYFFIFHLFQYSEETTTK